MKRIAIIGAGISGLALAQQLHESAEVRIFEKSRGYGGRMASRARGDFRFDHGAQFFTARSDVFNQFLQPYIKQGVIANWDARFVELERDAIMQQRTWAADHPHYVAVPGMNALGKAMASGLNVQLETTVANIHRTSSGWQLADTRQGDLGCYDWVVLAIPAQQAAQLMPAEFQHQQVITSKQMLGCYSLMLGFEQALSLSWDAALVRAADISWISVNRSKPGRDGGYALLVHSTNSWAEQNIATDTESVVAHLMHETALVLQQDVSMATHIELHRWRYANIDSQQGAASLVDPDNRLAAVGDWCIMGRIESAYLSAVDAATKLKQVL